MKIFPAIDLYRGQAVRLLRGDYEKLTVYSSDPAAVAVSFRRQGAEYLHVVDLEGARDGGTPNYETVCRIIRESGLETEIGGGIRSLETIRKYLDAGAARVILGTAAVADPALLDQALRLFGDRIAVGADLKDGHPAVRGWRETGTETAEGFLARLRKAGVSTVICTDVSRDGAMQGTNRELYRKLSEDAGLRLIASGGVCTLEDVRALKEMGLYGAIIGKALYTGDIQLKEAVEEAE